MTHWKTRRQRLTDPQFDALAMLASKQVGSFMVLEPSLERAAKNMIQGVNPWVKISTIAFIDGQTRYAATTDGRGMHTREAAIRRQESRDSETVRKR